MNFMLQSYLTILKFMCNWNLWILINLCITRYILVVILVHRHLFLHAKQIIDINQFDVFRIILFTFYVIKIYI